MARNNPGRSLGLERARVEEESKGMVVEVHLEGSDERIEGLLLSRLRHADLPGAAHRILHHGLWTPEGCRGDLQAVSLQGAPDCAARTGVWAENGLESPSSWMWAYIIHHFSDKHWIRKFSYPWGIRS